MFIYRGFGKKFSEESLAPSSKYAELMVTPGVRRKKSSTHLNQDGCVLCGVCFLFTRYCIVEAVNLRQLSYSSCFKLHDRISIHGGPSGIKRQQASIHVRSKNTRLQKGIFATP